MPNNFPFSTFNFQTSINVKAKPKEGSELVSGANQLGSGTNQLKKQRQTVKSINLICLTTTVLLP